MEAADLHEALADLAAVSLASLEAEREQFSVHRLVQDVTRRSLAPAVSQQRVAEALAWVNAAFAGDPGDVRTWPRLDPLAPHAQAVIQRAHTANIAGPTARLMNQLGLLFDTKSLHAQAEPLYRRALAIDEASFGPDHPNVAIRLNNLAELLRATNRLAEAEPPMRRAVAIDEASFGPDHPTVARDFNNLAQLLQDTNRLAEAEPLMRRALAIDEVSFGPDHPEVATDLSNLATLLQATDRLAEAEPLMRRMVAIFIDFSRKTGHPHPYRNAAISNYAGLLATMGKSEAEIKATIASLTCDGGSQDPQ